MCRLDSTLTCESTAFKKASREYKKTVKIIMEEYGMMKLLELQMQAVDGKFEVTLSLEIATIIQ